MVGESVKPLKITMATICHETTPSRCYDTAMFNTASVLSPPAHWTRHLGPGRHFSLHFSLPLQVTCRATCCACRLQRCDTSLHLGHAQVKLGRQPRSYPKISRTHSTHSEAHHNTQKGYASPRISKRTSSRKLPFAQVRKASLKKPEPRLRPSLVASVSY